MDDPNVHPAWAAETKRVASALDAVDYFKILGVSRDAEEAEIKARYHALQRTYHPDAFFQSPDRDLYAAVFAIAKRVTEAYVVLRDRAHRDKYKRDIEGPDGAKKLRFTEDAQSEARKEKEQEFGKTAQGRQLVQKAILAAKRGDFAGAERDLKMALVFERDNAAIQTKLAEVQAQLKPKK